MSFPTHALNKSSKQIVHTSSADPNHYIISDATERLINYEMIWVKSGLLLLELNLKSYYLEAGTVCYLAPGQIRRIKTDSDMQMEYLRIESNYFYSVCAEVRFPLIPVDSHHQSRPMLITIKPGCEQELSEIFIKISDLSDMHEGQVELLNIWLRLFMVYLKRNIEPGNSANLQSRDMELANRFLALLSQYFTTKKMVADYANELNVTPNYLNQIVKRVSGFSASHHIQQFLILEAKRLARASTRSMKQIAYDLGFDDISHFSKFFKNKSGLNFTTFKKTLN
jgi:AraC family transcriptional regulator, transcriptional activator of pobA